MVVLKLAVEKAEKAEVELAGVGLVMVEIVAKFGVD